LRLPVSSPLQLDRLAVRQQLGRLQTRLEEHHLVEIWRLRNWSEGRRLLHARYRDDPRAREGAEAGSRVGEVGRAITDVGSEGDEGSLS
jgi:hypothetical protein